MSTSEASQFSSVVSWWSVALRLTKVVGFIPSWVITETFKIKASLPCLPLSIWGFDQPVFPGPTVGSPPLPQGMMGQIRTSGGKIRNNVGSLPCSLFIQTAPLNSCRLAARTPARTCWTLIQGSNRSKSIGEHLPGAHIFSPRWVLEQQLWPGATSDCCWGG